MRKISINKDNVRNAIRTGCGLVIAVTAFVLPNLDSLRNTIDDVKRHGNVTYSDVISTILNSSMYSTDKAKVVNIVPKDGDVELYKSIIQIVKSNMYSGDKISIIKDICGVKEEEEA